MRGAAACLALAACAPVVVEIGAPMPAPQIAAGLCDAALYQTLIGRPAAEIDQATLPRAHRIVCADCAATADYVPDRLTVRLDANGRVASLACQ